jgi:uncharacterized cupredoxin-like copper-binding protein
MQTRHIRPGAALFLLMLALSLGAAAPVHAHGEKHGAAKTAAPVSEEERAFGRQGRPNEAARTIRIDMNDAMRFAPMEIKVRQGETVRFIVTNSGKLMHEMVLGTMDELKQHGELMKQHPGMEHDEPYMVHVAPGKNEEMVWQFTQPGEFHYGCLIPGHFEAGMVGKVIVTKA